MTSGSSPTSGPTKAELDEGTVSLRARVLSHKVISGGVAAVDFFENKREGALFLSAALRARDMNENAALRLVVNFVRFRRKNGWNLRVRASDDGRVWEAFKSGVHYVLPKPDNEGRSVVVLRPANIKTRDGNLKVEDYQRMASIIMQYATGLCDNDDTTWRDIYITLVVDLSDVGIACCSQFGIDDIKRGIQMWQDCFPVKLRKIVIVNGGHIVRGLVKVAKTFVEKKLQDRIDHSTEPAELKAMLGDETNIPKCWGGSLDGDAWWQDWCDKTMQRAAVLRDEDQDETKHHWWRDFADSGMGTCKGEGSHATTSRGA